MSVGVNPILISFSDIFFLIVVFVLHFITFQMTVIKKFTRKVDGHSSWVSTNVFFNGTIVLTCNDYIEKKYPHDALKIYEQNVGKDKIITTLITTKKNIEKR